MEISAHRPEQPIIVTIEIKNEREARELLSDLQTWKPTMGWSGLTSEFFECIEEALNEEA